MRPSFPFPFHPMADAFSQILIRGEEQNLFKGFRVGKQPTPLSHLQFAGDTTFFGWLSLLRNLISLIHCFELVLGMRINWQKSCFVGINSPSQDFLRLSKPYNAPLAPFRLITLSSFRMALERGIFGFQLLKDVIRN